MSDKIFLVEDLIEFSKTGVKAVINDGKIVGFITEGDEQMYYHTCPYCGANLDPDEKCDCREEKENDN